MALAGSHHRTAVRQIVTSPSRHRCHLGARQVVAVAVSIPSRHPHGRRACRLVTWSVHTGATGRQVVYGQAACGSVSSPQSWSGPHK